MEKAKQMQPVWLCILSGLQVYDTCNAVHYAEVWKMGLKVVNFDKLFLHQFSMKIHQTLRDGVKTSKKSKKLLISQIALKNYF